MCAPVGRAAGYLCELGAGTDWIVATGGLTVTDADPGVDQPVAYTREGPQGDRERTQGLR